MSSIPKFKNILINIIDEGKIWIIQINRPNHRNACNPETSMELFTAFKLCDQDEHSKISIFTGNEQAFCAGFDLQYIANSSSQDLLQQNNKWLEFSTPPGMGLSRLITKKPIIGAIHGYAVAGGLELSLCCDMLVSHKEATFGVFCRRFGVPLMDGGTVRLAKVIGLNRARDMILTGRPVSGQEAYDWGLVSRLVPKEKVLQEAIELAKSIIIHPEMCMRGDRKSLYECTFPNFEKDMMNEFRIGFITVVQGETVKGATSFSKQKMGRHGDFQELKPKL